MYIYLEHNYSNINKIQPLFNGVYPGQSYRNFPAAVLAKKINRVTNQATRLAKFLHAKRRLNLVNHVCLLYGFSKVRQFDAGAGVMAFSIDELNVALGITHATLGLPMLDAIKEGITPSPAGIDHFSQLTSIDRTSAGVLLKAWSECLSSEFQFIAIDHVLSRKEKKYGFLADHFIKHAIKKNNFYACKLTNEIVEQAGRLFKVFINQGTARGFETLACWPYGEREELRFIINTLFFRRTSKLALIWSFRWRVPVIFDVHFNYAEAHDKTVSGYRPITYSEYKFYKKYPFTHVMERRQHLKCIPKHQH